MTTRAKHISRIGQAHLQEAVLDVLFGVYKSGVGLKPKAISKRAGIYQGTIHGENRNQNHIVAGILGMLWDQGKVVADGTQGAYRAWCLAESEYNARNS